MPFYPGPGLGGHCIPIDPLYLSWKLKSLNYTARFIELAMLLADQPALRRRLGVLARETALAHGWAGIVQQTVGLYRAVIVGAAEAATPTPRTRGMIGYVDAA